MHIELSVSGQRMRREMGPGIVGGSRYYLTAHVAFAGTDWDGCQVWLKIDQVGAQNAYLLDENGCVTAERGINLPAGQYTMSLLGLRGDVRITTNTVPLCVLQSGADGGDPLPEIPQTAAEQIALLAQEAADTARSVRKDADEGQFNGKDGAPGKDGVSAEHKWVGSVLTITSASGTSSADLRGPQGTQGPEGKQGPQGVQGQAGKDAPQDAVRYGVQALDEAQQAIARGNIRAASAGEVGQLKDDLADLANISRGYADGANRFNKDIIESGFINNANGDIGGKTTNYVTSDFIPVGDKVGEYVNFSSVNSSGVVVSTFSIILFYKADKTPIADTFKNASNAVKTAVIPSGAEYLRVSFDDLSSHTRASAYMVIVGNEGAMPNAYVPYVGTENIAEIKESAIPQTVKRPNPHKLFFTGDVVAEYDGTEDKTVNIAIGKNDIIHDIIVGSSSSADFTTITDAVASISDSAKNNIYNIMIEDGVYEEKDIELPNRVNLIGISGIRENVWIKGEQSDSATDSVITPSSTVNARFSHILKNIKITCKNMRYPVHCESGNANHDWNITVDNCHIEHYGTDGANAYRTENGLTETDGYNNLWTSCHGWGEGASQGAYALFKDTTFKSVECAWYVHEGDGQTKPYIHEFYNCEFLSTQETSYMYNPQAIIVDNTRAVPINRLVFNNCYFGGDLTINAVYPIDIRVNGYCPCIRSMWKNGGSIVESYFSNRAYPTIANYMKEVLYNGTDALVGGEVICYDGTSQSVVKASSTTDVNLIAGIAIGGASTGEKIKIQTGGYIYYTKQSVGRYFGVDDSGMITGVSDKTKALAIGCGGWYIKLLIN